jgi:hypothetical protein
MQATAMREQGPSRAAPATAQESPFFVPPILDTLGGLVGRFPAFWIWMAGLESRRLADRTQQLSVRMPIYVCGLARSGSTLLHEVISSHPSVATHRVKDFPLVFTPYWWRHATANQRAQTPRERVHRDGVMITGDSPDALEEMLWMAFFPRCHDPSTCSLLQATDRRPEFESFYDLHIRKLLLAEGKTRYAAKANYHIARLPYLARLWPDARFIIPVRDPATHIASLMRQNRWFSVGQRKHPRALAYMRRSGHFEFGLDRRPMHLGDPEKVCRVVRAWKAGDEVRGLAIYWDMVHGYLARLLAENSAVRDAALVVRFESLCAAPAQVLQDVLRHCALQGGEQIAEGHAPRIRTPSYYDSGFTPNDLAVIREETATTASHWGY